MSKGAYIGVDGIARKIKAGYIGIDGIARKIRKAYIGVGGVARPCWTGGELAYWGKKTWATGKANVATAVAGKQYAILAGGSTLFYPTTYYGTTVCYDTSITYHAVENFQNAKESKGTTLGNYAIFAFGRNDKLG